MPSMIEIVDDDAGGEKGSATVQRSQQSTSPKAAYPRSAPKSSKAQAPQRRITPMTDNVKHGDASASNNKKKKSKQQANFESFFAKAPPASTPSLLLKTTNKKKAPTEASQKTTKRQTPTSTQQPSLSTTTTAKQTTRSPSSAASHASSKSSRHNKEDYKDIVIGKLLTGRTTSSAHNKTKTPPEVSDPQVHQPRSSRNDDNNNNSMLPTIPPLAAVLVQEMDAQATPPQEEMEPMPSQDESEASAPGYGALRSQLVQLFDSQTNSDTKEGQGVQEESKNNEGMETSEIMDEDEEVVCVGVMKPNDEEDGDPTVQVVNITTSNHDEKTKVDSEAKESAQESRQEDTARPIDLSSPKKEFAPEEWNQERSKYEAMIRKYRAQASELVAAARQGLEDEDVTIPLPSTDNITLGATAEFPDGAVPHLVCLLEGSKLPLSELARHACETLNQAFHGASLSLDVVSAKIKVMASRKPYLKNPAMASGAIGANTVSNDVVTAEDVNMDHMWRWEVTLLDLLPEDSAKHVRLARTARKRIQQRFNATVNLLRALDETVKLLQETDPPKAKLDKALGSVSREEEKVLKFEQEAEKARLLTEAKKQKEAQKEACKSQKEREKEEKKRAAEERKREKEEAKKKKEEQALSEQKKKEKEKEKQKNSLMAFFGKPSAKKAKAMKPIGNDSASVKLCKLPISKTGFSVEEFRSNINSQLSLGKNRPFARLSKRARASRKPKSKRVKMRVFVSARSPEDPFAPPAFAEERVIEVRDRNKFLAFLAFDIEAHRPPYHGTWSKTCDFKKLGRNPFSKEASLDYDVDSEAEWEEGDDDPGEDIENDAGDDEDEKALDEEGDSRVYNYQDGWLAEDDEISVEDGIEMDDDTKKLLKASRKRAENAFVPVCIVAPAFGGVPIVEAYGQDDSSLQDRVNGFPVDEAYKLVSSHHGEILAETEVVLDAFPPPLLEERDGAESNEPSEEDMKTFARFVHHSELVSKSQVVEELRSTHPAITSSRAQAHRILDSMALKQRHPNGGVYWEVKTDFIKNLGLEGELKAMVLPVTPAKDSKKRRIADVSDSTEPKKKKAKESNQCKKSEAAESIEPRKKKAKADPSADSASKSKGSATKKKPAVSAASANLMKNFLAKKK